MFCFIAFVFIKPHCYHFVINVTCVSLVLAHIACIQCTDVSYCYRYLYVTWSVCLLDTTTNYTEWLNYDAIRGHTHGWGVNPSSCYHDS